MVRDKEETWRDVKGASDYEVSNLGEVRRKGAACALSQKLDRYGLFTVPIVAHGRESHRWVHVLVAVAFHDHPMGAVVKHIDDNKLNNRADNLTWQLS